jgi:hypothetical protein
LLRLTVCVGLPVTAGHERDRHHCGVLTSRSERLVAEQKQYTGERQVHQDRRQRPFRRARSRPQGDESNRDRRSRRQPDNLRCDGGRPDGAARHWRDPP